MTVGGFLFDDTIVIPSKPYFFENLVFVVPNASPYSSVETLFLPFTLSTWILIAVTVMLAALVIKILEHCNRAYYEFVVGVNNYSPYLNLMHVLITAGAIYEPRRSFARFLLMLWILVCLILQTVYQGQLYSFIKMNKMKENIRSIDELIERNITVKTYAEDLESFLAFDERIDKL